MKADLGCSFTWVGVSPDDRYVVFPVRKVVNGDADAHELIVLDTADGSTRTVPDAKKLTKDPETVPMTASSSVCDS